MWRAHAARVQTRLFVRKKSAEAILATQKKKKKILTRLCEDPGTGEDFYRKWYSPEFEIILIFKNIFSWGGFYFTVWISATPDFQSWGICGTLQGHLTDMQLQILI